MDMLTERLGMRAGLMMQANNEARKKGQLMISCLPHLTYDIRSVLENVNIRTQENAGSDEE